MEEIMKYKNKSILLTFVVFLLAYTQTDITKITLLNINFELKETYLLNSFNDIFYILWGYYSLLFLSTVFSQFDSNKIKEIEKEEKMFIFHIKNYNFFFRVLFYSFAYLSTYKFLNIILPIIIILLSFMLIVADFNIDKIYTGIIFAVLFVGYIFYLQKDMRKELKKLDIETKELDELIERYNKVVKNLENLTKEQLKIISHVRITIKKRQDKLAKKIDDYSIKHHIKIEKNNI